MGAVLKLNLSDPFLIRMDKHAANRTTILFSDRNIKLSFCALFLAAEIQGPSSRNKKQTNKKHNDTGKNQDFNAASTIPVHSSALILFCRRLQVQGYVNIGSEVLGSTFKVIIEPPKLGTFEP
jgi:hypothetical protein